MRKVYILILGVLCWNVNFAQWSDDFESYSEGDLIAESNSDWDTWTSDPGSDEDAPVSENVSNSGSKSLYFVSDGANGGPTDIVLPFGEVFNDGTFTVELMIYVDSDNGAYFNFQGDEEVGESWVLDVFITQDGNISVMNDQASVEVASATYVPETWNKFAFEMDLTGNTWEFFLNDESQGSWTNVDNEISHLNLFPWNGTANGGNGMASFYVDDVSFDASGASSVGIEESFSNDFNVYPNPTTGSLNIDSQNSLSTINSIEVYDLMGRTVFSESAINLDSENNVQIDLKSLPVGNYVLKIQSGTEIINRTISIE